MPQKVFERRAKAAKRRGSVFFAGVAPNVEQPPPTLADWMVPLIRYVLPQRVSVAIDQFFDGARKSSVLRVQKNDLKPALVAAAGVDWVIRKGKDPDAVLVGVVNDPSQRVASVPRAGIRCPYHDRLLTEVEQTNTCLCPFNCFVVQSNERCTNNIGKIYACQKTCDDGTTCPFALCADHFKTTVGQYLWVSFVGMIRSAFAVGFQGALAYIAIAVGSMIYFPIMQMCLSFLRCDPQYQCNFPHCWSDPDAKFIIAACVVIVTAIFVGLLMPAVLVWALVRRKGVLDQVFFHNGYHQMYCGIDRDAEKEDKEGQFDEIVEPGHERGLFFALARKLFPDVNSIVEHPEGKAWITSTRLSTLSTDEWDRFLAADESFLVHTYKTLEYEWMTFSPLLLVYKLILLCPLTFIEANTFSQMAAVCCVELLFGIFIFWSQPYLNPWVDTMYRAGAVHSVVLLGLTCWHLVLQANGDSSGLGLSMLVCTSIYMCFVVLMLLLTVVWPMVSYGVQQLRVESQLQRIGLRSKDLSSLLLNPLIHDAATLSPQELSHVDLHFRKAKEAGGKAQKDEGEDMAADESAHGQQQRQLYDVKRKSLKEMQAEKLEKFRRSRPNAVQM